MRSKPSHWWPVVGAVLGAVLFHRGRYPWFIGPLIGAPLAAVVGALVHDLAAVARRLHARPQCIACGARIVVAAHRVRCACGRTYVSVNEREVQLIELSPAEMVAARTWRSGLGLWSPWTPSLEDLAPERRAQYAEWLAWARAAAEMPSLERACRPSWWRFFFPAVFAAMGLTPWLLVAHATADATCPGGAAPLTARSWAILAFMTAMSAFGCLPALITRIDTDGVRAWIGYRARTIPWSEIAVVRVQGFGVEITARSGDRITINSANFAEPDWIAPLIARHAPADAMIV